MNLIARRTPGLKTRLLLAAAAGVLFLAGVQVAAAMQDPSGGANANANANSAVPPADAVTNVNANAAAPAGEVQIPPPAAAPPGTAPATAPALESFVSGTGGSGRGGIAPLPTLAKRTRWDALAMPEVDLPTWVWFAVVVILTLTLTSRPLLTARSFDGLMLALGGALLFFRTVHGELFGGVSSQTVAYLLLTLVAVYWLVRGWQTLKAAGLPRGESNVTEGPLLVLAVAAFAIAGSAIATEPLSRSAQDGMVGGVYMADTGKLPYGVTVGYDSRAPLLYALHAGALKVTNGIMSFGQSESLGAAPIPAPSIDVNDGIALLTWEQRARWSAVNWWEQGPMQAARLVNAVLFVLILLAVNLVGRRLHSPAMGLTMAAVFSVFPGTIESLNRPDVLLPTALLAWTLACAMLPAIGGFLATFLLVLAGTAWPWAWLALPLLILWFMRRGNQGIGALLALAAGIAAVVFGIVSFVQPAPPRADGALAAAGVTSEYVARVQDGGVVIERGAAEQRPADFKAALWRFLIADDDVKLTPRSGREPITFSGIEGQNVGFATLRIEDPAGDLLLPVYRANYGEAADSRRAAFRTLLEAVWLPAGRDQELLDPPTPWQVWFSERESLQVIVRRTLKVVTGVVALAIAFMVFSRRLALPHHLLGALLVTFALVQIASAEGAAGGLAWLAVLAVSLLAAGGASPPLAPAPGSVVLPPGPFGQTPRITVER